MKYFLDTNICVYFLKGKYPALAAHLKRHDPADIKIPAIVKAELLLGAEKSERRVETADKVNAFLGPYDIVPFDDNVAVVYAGLRARLEKKGNCIGPNDLLVAAIVMAGNGCLITHNIAEFNRVTELKQADWTE
ncbi:MAG: type II toxin-antitoxin system VapC family toxin [Fibrobacterota bacterium]